MAESEEQNPSNDLPDDQKPVVNIKADAGEITVVGIGASAGGLSALTAFFDALPGDTGMAYVVVTHLHPERESVLDELLQAHTHMPVCQVSRMTEVEPNHVYVIPPNRNILITDTHLDTEAFDAPRGHRAPIDAFFRSLADVHRNAIAIILSGGGSDGAVGIKAIKEQGGLLMVQDPAEAEHDSMPRAAIATGLVDVVLPVQELAAKLVEFQHQPVHLHPDPEALTLPEQETLHRILTQVFSRTGHDFTQYKRSTILRRIQRRMQLSGYATLDGYLGYLRHKGEEAHALFNDLLIGVTSFFRDRESWEALAEQVIPRLFEGKGVADTVRVWTIGCATGEESYGVAMLLMEYLSTLESRPQVQMFASDMDEHALALGREGLYPLAISDDVTPERLKKFFVKEGDHYRVQRELRDIILFADHNVLRDPPFSRLDLICCRNLLIYLEREVQDNVFEIFHYALNPNGYLFLGSSESAGGMQSLFRTVDKTHRIYQARLWRGERPPVPSLLMMVRHPRRQSEPKGSKAPDYPFQEPSQPLLGLHREGLEDYGPPSILVNEEYQIIHLSERAGRYLLHPRGPVSSDLVQVVRPELQFELRTVLFEAFEKKRAVVSAPVHVQFNGHPRRVYLSVRPRRLEGGVVANEERLALVVFLEDETDKPVPEQPNTPVGPGSEVEARERSDSWVAQLEDEVRRLRERRQANVEEHESSNEELKAANEELQSINEEYRSTTEELETSKEELQSVNEELQTVNNELKTKLEEISRANSDLENFMAATEIATLFLDRDLRIKRFTPGMEAVFNIMPNDRGRPIEHLTNKLGYDRLAEDARQVLQSLKTLEQEQRGPSGKWFLVRLRPYRTVDDRIDGVVVTYVDITRIKETELILREREKELARAMEYREKIVYTVREGLLVLKSDLTVEFANRSFYEKFKLSPGGTIGRKIYLLDKGQWDIPALRRLLEEVLPNNDAFDDYEMTHNFEGIGTRTLLLNGRRLEGDQLILLAIDDITARRRAIESLRERERQLERLTDTLEAQVIARTEELEAANQKLTASSAMLSSLFQANPIPTAIIRASDGTMIDVNDEFLEFFGLEREEVLSRPAAEVQQSWSTEADRARLIERLQQDGFVRGMELEINHPSGENRMVLASIEMASIQSENLIISSFIDITERVRAERQVRELASRLTMTEQDVRHQLAQVLHDDLQQRLYAIELQMNFLRDAVEKVDHEKLALEYQRIKQELDEAIRITRNLSVDLSPPILHDEGLREALGWLAAQMKEQYNLEVEVQAEESFPVPDTDMRVLLFQSVREALLNIVKHAGVSKARISLEKTDHILRIRIADAGVGFDPGTLEAAPKDRGLAAQHNRLSLFGGELNVESAPGSGTQITIVAPLQRPERKL